MIYLALIISNLSSWFFKTFGIGAGLTVPGSLGMKVYPGFFNYPGLSFKDGIILVSGTNGKTTTSKMISYVLEKEGYSVLHNKSGSNTLNGIASELFLGMDFYGKLDRDIAVLEVDEFYLPYLLDKLSPNIVVLLNLSRDQLDRYGEVDIVVEKWTDSFKKIDQERTTLVVDGTLEVFDPILSVFKGNVERFDDNKQYLKSTDFVGKFNAKNINAAVRTLNLVGIRTESVLNHLSVMKSAFGRGEVISYKEKDFKVLLAKNPSSFINNLDSVIEKDIQGDPLIFVLNDNIPDGRDVSWIYDIDSERLHAACKGKKILISGTRYLDMAVRMHYAGIPVEKRYLFHDLEELFSFVTSSEFDIDRDRKDKEGKRDEILVLPNYSGMLQVRKILTGKAIL